MKKTLFILLAIGASFISFSCNTGNSPATDTDSPTAEDNPTVTDTVAESDIAGAKEALSIESAVYSDENIIALPSVLNNYSAVKITWTSSDTSVIANDGTIVIPEGTGTTTVTLTATFTENNTSDTKTFTVTVYQKDYAYTDTQVVEMAKKRITIGFYTDVYTDQTVTLAQTITVLGKEVSVSWTKSSDSVHLAMNSANTKCLLHRDIVDISATLSVTATYGSASASKDIVITIDHIPEIKTTTTEGTATYVYDYTFTGSELTLDYTATDTANSGNNTSTKRKFSYTVDYTNTPAVITATTTSVYQNGTWMSKDAYTAYLTKQNTDMANAYAAVSANPCMDTMLTAYKVESADSTKTKEDLEAVLVKNYSSDFNNVTSVTEFEKLDTTTVNDGIQSLCTYLLQLYIDNYSLDSNTTWSDIPAVLNAYVPSDVNALFKENYTYSYSTIDSKDNSLYFATAKCWVKGEAWYNQVGIFYDSTTATRTVFPDSIIYISASEQTTINGSFNEEYSTFTGTTSGKKFYWTVTCDDDAHTITFTCSNGRTFTSEFLGDSLS